MNSRFKRDLHPTVNLVFNVIEKLPDGDFKCVTDDGQHFVIDIEVSAPTDWLEHNDPIGKWYDTHVFFHGVALISTDSIKEVEAPSD